MEKLKLASRDVANVLSGLRIDRSSAIPAYAQMCAQLVGVIDTLRRRGIDTFFTDDEIARHYGVSRMTARQSISEIVREGRLYRRRGVGTFIATPRVIEKEGPVGDFFEDWPSQGRRVTVEIAECRTVDCPGPVAAMLEIAQGLPVLYVRRRRLADGIPIAVDDRWIGPPGSNRITEEELKSRSIHLIVAAKLGLKVSKAQVRIEAALCPPEVTDLLELGREDPVLVRTVTPFGDNGAPLWTGRSVYRADLYTYSVMVRAS